MSTADGKRRRWDLLVLAAGLLVVTAVWLLACWWSFDEQTRAARALGFRHPAVLPWMLDALAFALALVALAAALNGQSAGTARLGVFVALGGSVWANTQGVSLRFGGHPHADAMAMAAIAPLSAFIALEVILGRIRRLVLWLRGETPPAAIPALRLVRLLLAPRTSFTEWRAAVLDRTAPTKLPVSSSSSARPGDDTQQDTAAGATPDGATGPGVSGPRLAPGPVPDTGEAGSPAGLSGQTTEQVHPSGDADASESGTVLHLAPPVDRISDAPGSASAGASRPASRRDASAASSASGPRRITASAGASATASDVPDPALLDAVRAHLILHSGAYPSGRALAAEMRVHQDKARAAIAHVRAERKAREVAP